MVRSWSAQYGARSSRLSTFIAADNGSGSVRRSTARGTLYPAMVLRALGDQFVGGGGAGLAEHADRVHRLAPDLVRNAEHGDLEQAGWVARAFSTSTQYRSPRRR